MENWSEVSEQTAQQIRVVFTDIDDTLSTKGKILPEAFSALWRLSRAGIEVVPITGRCAGWVDHISRFWPVRGVVGENGAFYAYMDYSQDVQKLKKRYFLQPEEVREAKKKFDAIKRDVFKKFPTCKEASDQPYREFDLAIDFREDVPPLSLDQVKEIVKIFEKYGARVKVSSIHVNGWFGDYDKLTMTKLFSEEQLDFSLDEHPDWALFIGDSPNDQPMFKFFPISIGVRNVENFGDMITDPPIYITEGESGLGFAEMVEVLLYKRQSQ
jgi:HAD superfamily hydrolase (TIGR01484 family)